MIPLRYRHFSSSAPSTLLMTAFAGASLIAILPLAAEAKTSSNAMVLNGNPISYKKTVIGIDLTDVGNIFYQLILGLQFDAHPDSFQSGEVSGDNLPGFSNAATGIETVVRSYNFTNLMPSPGNPPLQAFLLDSHGSKTTGSATLTFVHNPINKTVDVAGLISNTTDPQCPIGALDCGEITGMTLYTVNVLSDTTDPNSTVSGSGSVSVTVNEVPGPLPFLGVGMALRFSRRLRVLSRMQAASKTN
jgi:hypothetical protein